MRYRWYADDPQCEVHAYPKAGIYAVLNNSGEERSTTVYDGLGRTEQITLEAGAIRWKTIQADAAFVMQNIWAVSSDL